MDYNYQQGGLSLNEGDDTLARLLSTNFTAVCQGKEKF